MYRQYFSGSNTLSIPWTIVAIFPYPRFIINRLLAFEDVKGFTLGLGIITDIDRKRKNLTILTPFSNDGNFDSIHLGDVKVDPATFRDEAIL
jgi:polynucleotide 5'-kinase involved in rRNA processing